MSTISPTRIGGQDRPRRRRRWPLLAGLVLVLAAAAAALRSVSERVDRTTFTAAGADELVVAVHAGRIELVPSPDGHIQVTTTRSSAPWGSPAAPWTSGSPSRPGRGSG